MAGCLKTTILLLTLMVLFISLPKLGAGLLGLILVKNIIFKSK